VAPVEYPPAFVAYTRAMRAADLSSVQRRSDVEKQLVEAVESPATRAFLLQNLILDDHGARWRPNLPVIEASLPEISGWPADLTASYDGPTLFVYGADSDYVRAKYHDTVRRYFPGAEFTAIEGAGHWVHAERLDDFLATLTPFLT
jgi:pimeloyl-ACP methyl ester carboxylesterase